MPMVPPVVLVMRTYPQGAACRGDGPTARAAVRMQVRMCAGICAMVPLRA